jgi:selenide,water dikinase
VDDAEPKYGLCVTGVVHPDRVLTNAGAEPGDVLILTKPIGSGIISTAAKRGQCPPEWLAEAVRVMSKLNRAAAEVAARFPIHACTDVSGFGLLGHLAEMTRASHVNAEVTRSAVPLLPGIVEVDVEDLAPGGTERNLTAVEGRVEWDGCLSRADRLVLCDAQTSGGLLLAVPSEVSGELLAALRDQGVAAAVIGRCVERGEGTIRVWA